jgi:glutathione S-transferase
VGQAKFLSLFFRKYQPAIDRYYNESRRSCEVVDCHLESTEWVVEDYSIADIEN